MAWNSKGCEHNHMKNTLIIMAVIGIVLLSGCQAPANQPAAAVNVTGQSNESNLPELANESQPSGQPAINQTIANVTLGVTPPVATPETRKLSGTIKLQTCYHEPENFCRMENFNGAVAVTSLKKNDGLPGPLYGLDDYEIISKAQANGTYSLSIPAGNYSIFAKLNGSWFCGNRINSDLCPIRIAEQDLQKDILVSRQVYT